MHVDATDLYETSAPELAAEAARRQDIVFLALDLVTGRVRPGHSAPRMAGAHGVCSADLAWFDEQPCNPDLIGINLYPLFSEKRLVALGAAAHPHAVRLGRHHRPPRAICTGSAMDGRLFISETASEGSLARAAALARRLRSGRTARVRARGVPLIGYTWWPLFALVTWGYREGKKAPGDYLRQMGLWDLRHDADGLRARADAARRPLPRTGRGWRRRSRPARSSAP